MQWDVVDSSWRERFARVKLDVTYRARFLLDETHHELRSYEILRSSSFFMGFDGSIPRLSFSYWLQAGFVNAMWAGHAYGILPGFPPRIGEVRRYALNTAEARDEIKRTRSGCRLGLPASHVGISGEPAGSYRLFEALAQAPLRRVPRRWFYGVLYPFTFFASIAFRHGDAGRAAQRAQCAVARGDSGAVVGDLGSRDLAIAGGSQVLAQAGARKYWRSQMTVSLFRLRILLVGLALVFVQFLLVGGQPAAVLAQTARPQPGQRRLGRVHVEWIGPRSPVVISGCGNATLQVDLPVYGEAQAGVWLVDDQGRTVGSLSLAATLADGGLYRGILDSNAALPPRCRPRRRPGFSASWRVMATIRC